MPRRRAKQAAASVPEKRLDYGVYAAHISAAQREQLFRMPALGSHPEIHLLRALVDAFLTRMEACEDEDRQIKLFNAALSAMQRLLMALRTQHSLENSTEAGLGDFNKALADMQEEMGLRGMD